MYSSILRLIHVVAAAGFSVACSSSQSAAMADVMTDSATAEVIADSGPSIDSATEGACMVACSGVCAEGRCQVFLATGATGNDIPVPYNLVVDDASVYWTTYANGFSGLVQKAPIAGGAITMLASTQRSAHTIALDSTNVYWVDNASPGAVMEIPLGGGTTPVTLAPMQNMPHGLTIDSLNVYWSNTNDQNVMSLPLAGGSPTTIATGQRRPEELAVDHTHIYWTNWVDGGTVAKAPLDGGMPVILATGNDPYGIVVDQASVYWTNSGDFDVGADTTGAVMRMSVDGGQQTVLASNQDHPFGIAVDTTFVYWTNYNHITDAGSVMKVRRDGGPAVILASNIYAYGIAVDQTSVYCADYGNGRIVKITPK